ncbi:MAG: GNAT family N-acetyltransferase [Chloroflexi bacterium]|nr:GNAT family N-acetyltransferase [Chloroflexota bacterium]
MSNTRPLDWSDLPSLIALANREVLRQPESVPLAPARLRSLLTAPGVSLAADGRGVEKGGQLVAWTVLWSPELHRQRGRGIVLGPALGDVAQAGTAEALGWIDVLGVVPAWRRRGIGRALLLYGLLSLWDRGVLAAGLEADADNAPALRLYHSLGFVEVSTSVHYRIEVKS